MPLLKISPRFISIDFYVGLDLMMIVSTIISFSSWVFFHQFHWTRAGFSIVGLPHVPAPRRPTKVAETQGRSILILLPGQISLSLSLSISISLFLSHSLSWKKRATQLPQPVPFHCESLVFVYVWEDCTTFNWEAATIDCIQSWSRAMTKHGCCCDILLWTEKTGPTEQGNDKC